MPVSTVLVIVECKPRNATTYEKKKTVNLSPGFPMQYLFLMYFGRIKTAHATPNCCQDKLNIYYLISPETAHNTALKKPLLT